MFIGQNAETLALVASLRETIRQQAQELESLQKQAQELGPLQNKLTELSVKADEVCRSRDVLYCVVLT